MLGGKFVMGRHSLGLPPSAISATHSHVPSKISCLMTPATSLPIWVPTTPHRRWCLKARDPCSPAELLSNIASFPILQLCTTSQMYKQISKGNQTEQIQQVSCLRADLLSTPLRTPLRVFHYSVLTHTPLYYLHNPTHLQIHICGR